MGDLRGRPILYCDYRWLFLQHGLHRPRPRPGDGDGQNFSAQVIVRLDEDKFVGGRASTPAAFDFFFE